MAEPYGTLAVRVYTGRAQIPLADATVSITQKAPGGRHNLLSIQVTDENGRAGPVPIAAPAAVESEIPGGIAPFTLCDLWADHPDYKLMLVKDVQVFAGVETLQEMELIPLPEHTDPRGAADEVQITPQEL